MAEATSKQLAFVISEYLSSCSVSNEFSAQQKESLQIAQQCVGASFGIDTSDAQQRAIYSIQPTNLMQLFQVYLNTKKTSKKVQIYTVCVHSSI